MGQRKSRTEIASLARAHTETVINVLISLVTREDVAPAARISAGLALLDRGWGKPTQKVEVDDDRPRIIEIINTIIDPRPNPELPQQPGRRLPNWDYDRYGDPDAPALSAPEASESEPAPSEPEPEVSVPEPETP
jgi:hypothetical protein